MKKSERTVSELAFLFKLLPVMQELESVDKIYRLLLAIATSGRSMGYRRAMVFEVDEKDSVIRGRFGVEMPAEHATTDKTEPTFEERAREVFAVYESVESSDVSLQAKSFSVPLAWHRSALVKAARTTYPVLAEREITEDASDPFLSFFESSSYVAVPIKMNDRVVAVLAADRAVEKTRGSVEDISLLYSLSQQASAAAQHLIDVSVHRRRSRIARKLQQILNDADTCEKLDEGLRLALIMVTRAVGGSGCLLKDFTRQKTIHIKTVQEYSPDANDDDAAIGESFDTILDQTVGDSESTVGDNEYPLLSHDAAARVACFCATPLVSGDNSPGALAVYTERPKDAPTRAEYAPEEIGFIEVCAGLVAAKLETVQLEDRIGRTEGFLEEVNSNLSRERERSRLAERSFDLHSRLTKDLETLSELLASRKPYSKRFPKISEIIEDMQVYSRDLMSDAQADDSHFELVDIFEMTRKIVEGWRPTVESEGIEVTARIPTTGPSLLMEGSKVSLALDNILKATASCLKSGDKVLVECSTSKDRILLCFADNSTGIPGDAISRLFMPFNQIDHGDEKKRALSLAGEIIQKHSGEILIRSSMSWKTILILSFPKRANLDRRGKRNERRHRSERRSVAPTS